MTPEAQRSSEGSQRDVRKSQPTLVPSPRESVSFSMHVTLGDILTGSLFILGLAVSWTKMDSRITAVETLVQADHVVMEELVRTTVKLNTIIEIYQPKIQALEDDRNSAPRR